MRVLALGGAGDMGRTAVTTLINSPGIEAITVADRNYESAEKFINLANTKKASATKIDVTDRRQLMDLISRHDLVMSSVGPYYKFGPSITEACIEAGKSCADICDDWKPMLNVLSMDEKARQAGITIIPGIGASPGLSNLMAVLGASELDEVDEIVTAWGAGKAVSGPPQPHHVKKKFLDEAGVSGENAAVAHLLYECLESIPTFRNGAITYIEPLSDAAPIRFPGHEDTRAYHIGHPEPVTIPRAVKANSVSNVMFYGKSFIELLRKFVGQIKQGVLSIEQAALQLQLDMITNAEIIGAESTSPLPPICATVTGMKNGTRKRIAVGLTHIPYGQMAGSTGVPLAIAIMMLAEGRITLTGVQPPELAIEPRYFLNRYAKYCGEGLSVDDVLLKKEDYL